MFHVICIHFINYLYKVYQNYRNISNNAIKQKSCSLAYGRTYKYCAYKQVVETDELLPDFSVGSNQIQGKKHQVLFTPTNALFHTTMYQSFKLY